MLRKHMTDHIKQKSGNIQQLTMLMVDNLFGKMVLSYQIKNGEIDDFTRAQELAKGIVRNLKPWCTGNLC